MVLLLFMIPVRFTIIVRSPLSVWGRKLVKGGLLKVDQFNDAEYKIKIRLIDEMQHHPCIYDKAHKDHYCCDKKFEVFGIIGSLLNLNGKPLISMILSRSTIAFLHL